MMAFVSPFKIFFLLVLIAVPGLVRAQVPPASVVVVYNTADPSSVALAKYYADRRKIPADNLIALTCPTAEEISRAEYDLTIAGPLKSALGTRGFWEMQSGRVTATKVRYAVLIKGMPLKVRSVGAGVVARPDQPPEIGKRDEASVDSELACMGLGDVPTAGIIPNPYFRRFTPIINAIADPGLLLVCRLDAPTDGGVRSMIDGAISAERDGLWGWGYVDSRSITTGGYAEGDQWLGILAAQMREKGIPVLWDKAPETLPAGYPVTDAAVYYGWYADTINGPFAAPLFSFRTGAVAVHIHSFSAATLRDPRAGWCGPLVERGVAATVGNVYEPYLTLTSHLDVLQDRLMAGFTFAESAYSSLRALSWMNVVIGDPIYRPYAAWQTSGSVGNQTSWGIYRRIVLAADGKILAAAAALKNAATENGNSMFLESLAAVQADSGDLGSALDTLNQALTLEKKPQIRFRLTLEKIGLLRAQGQNKEAGELVLTQKSQGPSPLQGALLDQIYQQIYPPPPSPPSPAPSTP